MQLYRLRCHYHDRKLQWHWIAIRKGHNFLQVLKLSLINNNCEIQVVNVIWVRNKSKDDYFNRLLHNSIEVFFLKMSSKIVICCIMCHINGCVIIQNNIPGIKHYANLYILWYSNNSLDLLTMLMMFFVFFHGHHQ